ncbi:hypothetical protein LEMLEM_LOCUS27676 [Lemmus lemmus]
MGADADTHSLTSGGAQGILWKRRNKDCRSQRNQGHHVLFYFLGTRKRRGRRRGRGGGEGERRN